MNTVHSDIGHLRRIATAMDSAIGIPGTKFRIGLDGIVGLIPGVGDIFGLAVSSYFILVAARMGVSRPVLARMILNVAVDSAVGTIPVVGDLFDFAWKSNQKNLALIERSAVEFKATKARSIFLLAAIGLGILAVMSLVIVAIVQIATWLVAQLP